jgi:O-antigen/teichoic acid export membrane protein
MPFTYATTYLTNFQKKITTSYARIINSPIIKNFFIFSFGSIMLRGISIALVPFTLSMLNPSDYGLLSLFTSFNTIFIAIIGLGLRQSFYLEYFHCLDEQRKSMTNTILGIYILIATPLTFMAFALHPILNALLFCNAATPLLIALSLGYCFLFFFVELFYQHLQYESKALPLTLLQTSIALITIGLNIFFLYGMGLGVQGILLGSACSAAIACTVAAYYYIKADYVNLFSFRQSVQNMAFHLRQGAPFIPGILFAWIVSSGDKWVLARYATLHDVGIYAIADAFSQLFYVVILYPLSGSYLPWLFKQFAHNPADIKTIEQRNKKIMYMSMLGMACAITAGYVLGKPVLNWALPYKYHESILYIWLILMGNIFWMGTYFASALIQYHKKSSFLGLAICLPALLNIGLNIALIPPLGIYGCSLATLLAYMAYFCLILGYNRRLIKKHI